MARGPGPQPRSPVDRRATLVEYGLIAAPVVLAVFAGPRLSIDATTGMWDHVAPEMIAGR